MITCPAVCTVQVMDNNYSSLPLSAERNVHSVRSQILIVKLASLVYHDRAPYTPTDVHHFLWQMVSVMCKDQASMLLEPCCSSAEADMNELSSEEQDLHRLNGILMHLLLPILRHAVKTLTKTPSADSDAVAIGHAAATFCLAKLGLLLKTGHLASQRALTTQLWQSGELTIACCADSPVSSCLSYPPQPPTPPHPRPQSPPSPAWLSYCFSLAS